MRALFTILLLCLAVSARAVEWKNEIFHCAANIPESPGWQIIDAPPAPGIAPVLTMQNAAKQAVFGISVVEKYRDAKISDITVQKELETQLRQFGYEFVGHGTVKAGGFDWLQYPVRAGAGAQQVRGVIRYASAGGYVFGITMLRGGGQVAAQDAELQQAAASFRVLPAITVSTKQRDLLEKLTTAQQKAQAQKMLAKRPKESRPPEPPARQPKNFATPREAADAYIELLKRQGIVFSSQYLRMIAYNLSPRQTEVIYSLDYMTNSGNRLVSPYTITVKEGGDGWLAIGGTPGNRAANLNTDPVIGRDGIWRRSPMEQMIGGAMGRSK